MLKKLLLLFLLAFIPVSLFGVAQRGAFFVSGPSGNITYTSTANMYWSSSNARLGIGTSSPSEKLQVVGTTNSTYFVGDGAGLTNVVASTVSSNVVTNNYGGNVTLSGLLTASSVTISNTVSTNMLIASSATINGTLIGVTQLSAQSGTFSGTVTASAFAGDGTLLTVSSNIVTNNYGANVSINSRLYANQLSIDNLQTGGVLFVSSNLTVTQDVNHLYFDPSNNYLGIGTNAPDAGLTITDTSGFAAPQNGTKVHLVTNGSINARITGDVYSNATALGFVFQGRRARGSVGAPSAPNADDTLALIGGVGYGTSSFPNASVGAYTVKAENSSFTNTSQASYLAMYTSPTGSITASERMRITSSGLVGIGTSSPSSTLSVSGNVTCNGTVTANAFYGPTIGNITGVNAITGNVGEFKFVTASLTAASSGVTFTLVTASITAGDWNVGGMVEFSGDTGNTGVIIITDTAASFSGQIQGVNRIPFAISPVQGAGGGTIAPFRINISSTTNYYLNVVIFGHGTGTCTGAITMRRAT